MFPLFSIQNLSPDYASSPKRFPKKEVRLRQVPVLPGNPLGGLGNPLGGFGDLAASPKPKLESNVLPERGAGYVVSFQIRSVASLKIIQIKLSGLLNFIKFLDIVTVIADWVYDFKTKDFEELVKKLSDTCQSHFPSLAGLNRIQRYLPRMSLDEATPTETD